ncbi:hypothetical protein BLOT_004504 [Blomia tropicalis]|nr:hypothetical protein BLOT_004504 [Blomia tropicalis]
MISITEPTDSKGFSELLFNVFPIEKIHGFPQKWTDIIKDEKECIIKIMGIHSMRNERKCSLCNCGINAGNWFALLPKQWLNQ